MCAAPGRIAVARPHHLRVRSAPGVSERIDAKGSRRRYASLVYYTEDAIRDKIVVECLHSRRKGLIRQIPQETDPCFRERVDC